MTYQAMTEPDDLPGCTAIIDSLKKRWSKTDQEIFIATLIINSFFGQTPLTQSPHFNNAGITALRDQVWRQVFRTDNVPTQFYTQVHDYLTKSREFSQLDFTCQLQKLKAEEKKQAPDPVDVYDDYKYGQDDHFIFQLGRKLLSITANSASCERLFSKYGVILSKCQSRLLKDHMMQRAQLKAHIHDEHLRDDSMHKHAKQHFSSIKDRQKADAKTATAANPSLNSMESSSQGDHAEGSTSSDDSTSLPNIFTSTSSESPDLQGSTFSSFVNQQWELVTEDDTDSEPLFDGTLPSHRPAAQTTRLPLLKLTELFDFNNTHWAAAVRRAQEDSFEKELEFYELLDLDAEGEDDLDVDNTTEQVLGFE